VVESSRRGSVLLSGKSTGCRSCNNRNKLRPFEALFNFLVSQAKGRTTVELTYSEYLTFTTTKECHYCHIPIDWRPHWSNPSGHHLDRKDNCIGYTKDNCVVCCGPCNKIKSDHFKHWQMKKIGELIRQWREGFF